MPAGERSLVTILLALHQYTQKSEKLVVITVDEYQDYGAVAWTPTFRKNTALFSQKKGERMVQYLPAKLRELRTHETVVRGIIPFSCSKGH
jgi:hypothetical protein